MILIDILILILIINFIGGGYFNKNRKKEGI
jgi:multisubunit Na+/H+ antiporter MnhF subunit